MPSLSITNIQKRTDGAVMIQFSDGTGSIFKDGQVDDLVESFEGDQSDFLKRALVAAAFRRNPDDIKNPPSQTRSRTRMTMDIDILSETVVSRVDGR